MNGDRMCVCEKCGQREARQVLPAVQQCARCGGRLSLLPLDPFELEWAVLETQERITSTQRAIVALLDRMNTHDLIDPSALRDVLRLLDVPKLPVPR